MGSIAEGGLIEKIRCVFNAESGSNSNDSNTIFGHDNVVRKSRISKEQAGLGREILGSSRLKTAPSRLSLGRFAL